MATPKSKAGIGRRGRVRPKRNTIAWDTANPNNLQRQLENFERSLESLVNDAARSAVLQIIDGTAVPKLELPLHDKLEFRGAGVSLATSNDRNIVNIPGATSGITSATAIDGVDVSLPTETSLLVQASRDVFIDPVSANQNDYSGTGSASGTPYDTSDYMFILATGTVFFTGQLAPTADGTRHRVVYNYGTGLLVFTHNSGLSAVGNKYQCPSGISFTLNPNESCDQFYFNGYWWILSRRGRHSDLLGLTANDHTQYANSATGLDGIDASQVSQVTSVRRSRTTIGPFTLTTDQNNWNPSGWDTADIVIINVGSRMVFTGFQAPTANGTREKWLMMRSNTGSINHYATLSYFDTASSVGNRISCPDSADIDILKRQVVRLVYDDDLEIWRFDGTDAIQANGSRRWVADQSVGGFGFYACRDIQFDGQLANPPTEPTSDDQTILWQWVNADGNAPGMLSVMPAAGRMILHNVLDYVDETQVGSDSGTLGWDFSDIDGRDLSDGTFKLRALMVAQNVTDPDGDGEYDVVCVERWGTYSRTGAASNAGDSWCKNMEIVAATTKAYWELSNQAGSLDFVPGAGTIVGLDWDLPVATGTDTWHRWIIVTIEGGAHR